jgi:Zn-dependent peptidase ImmA (M78 family)
LNWIQHVVTKLKKKYKTTDPFELSSLMNIQVIPWDLHDEINGFYKYDKRNKYIFFNNNLSSELQRFVCAHELGHAVLHPRANTPFLRNKTFFSIDKIEVEANTFAVELTLPEKFLNDYQNTNISNYELTKIYGIPNDLAHLIKC